MSSNKKSRNKKQNNSMAIGGMLALVALVIVVVSIFVFRQSTSNAVPKISPNQYEQQYALTGATHVLIDVRTAEEFASEHIAGAINIPLQSLQDRLSEIPHNKPIVLYCHSGNRSSQAAVILNNAGYTNVFDMGGILAWTAAGLPTVQ